MPTSLARGEGDLFGRGYFLLTTRAPHHGESLTEVLLKHQMSEPSRLEQARRGAR